MLIIEYKIELVNECLPAHSHLHSLIPSMLNGICGYIIDLIFSVAKDIMYSLPMLLMQDIQPF